MLIQDLKKLIENKNTSFPDNVLILKYKDNKFICNQYINAICEKRNLEKVYIDSIYDVSDNSLFEDEPHYLYILDVEKLAEHPTAEDKNIIILCKSLPNDLEIDYVDMTEILPWHIESFAKLRLKGLDEKQINWLCQICKYDIFRIDQECKKLESFPEATQKVIFEQINEENGYSDLSDQNIFNFTNAIIKQEMNVVASLIPELESADLEPLGCVTILLKKFQEMTNFFLNPKATPASLKMSEKQFYFLKSHPEKYSTYPIAKILDNIEFLSNIDYQIKTGNLELTREQLLSYVVVNVLS